MTNMKTTTLNHRIKNYVKPTLRVGNEDGSVVDVIDDLQSTNVDDDLYLPNSAIVEEMMVELNPKAEITNADTAFKLLSDSNEALRRLDIIQMANSYPVTGYHYSTYSTMVRVDPGLEGILPWLNFSRRRLNTSIEGAKLDIIKNAYKVFVAWLRSLVDRVVAIFKKKEEPGEAKTVEEAIDAIGVASMSDQTANWERVKEIVFTASPTLYEEIEHTRVRKHNPRSNNQTETSEVIVTEPPVKKIIRVVYEKQLWNMLTPRIRGRVMDPYELRASFNTLRYINTGLPNLLRGMHKLTSALSDLYTSNSDASTDKLFDDFEKPNRKCLNDLHDLNETAVFRDVQTPPEMKVFLEGAKMYISDYDRLRALDIGRNQKDLNNLLTRINKLMTTIDEAGDRNGIQSELKHLMDVCTKISYFYVELGKMAKDIKILRKALNTAQKVADATQS